MLLASAIDRFRRKSSLSVAHGVGGAGRSGGARRYPRLPACVELVELQLEDLLVDLGVQPAQLGAILDVKRRQVLASDPELVAALESLVHSVARGSRGQIVPSLHWVLHHRLQRGTCCGMLAPDLHVARGVCPRVIYEARLEACTASTVINDIDSVRSLR